MSAAAGQEIQADFEAACLTVRLSAITANYRTYRRLTGPAAVAAVVKADAYGLGAARVVPALAEAGCDSFFVARLEEGVALRTIVPQARIFVLDGAHPDSVPALLRFSLTPVLNSLAQIAAWSAAALVGRAPLDAVLHVDTGMNRLGLTGEELATLAGEQAKRLAGLNLVLVMSHLACADEPENKMNATQLSRFRQARAMLAGKGAGTEAPSIGEQREVLESHFILALAVNTAGSGSVSRQRRAEVYTGKTMRKFGIRFAAHHPRGEEVRRRMIGISSLADWHAVLDEFYAAESSGTAAAVDSARAVPV